MGSPTRYVVLLRGINLGGRNRVAMADLRQMCEEIGASNVRTYIASGNVVVDSVLSPERIRRGLETAITSTLGHRIGVVVLTRTELRRIVKANPFAREPTAAPQATLQAGPHALHAAISLEPLPAKEVAAVRQIELPGEDVAVVGRAIYYRVPRGYGIARLPTEVERRVKTPLTVRNWRTITTLDKMATE